MSIDKEWNALKACFGTYLADDNFNTDGEAKGSLSELTQPLLYKLDNKELSWFTQVKGLKVSKFILIFLLFFNSLIHAVE